jgi:Domain of unknown function (DUF4157)
MARVRQPVQRKAEANSELTFAREVAQSSSADSAVMAHANTQTLSEALSNPETGQNLDTGAREILEPKFGHSFENVKIHAGGRADQMTKAVNARAFTTGQDVYFRQGEYQPQSAGGLHLLAHELTHTIQQSRGSVSGNSIGDGLALSDPNDAFEQEASSAADSVTRGERVSVAGTGGSGVQRMVLQREGPGPTAAAPPPTTAAPGAPTTPAAGAPSTVSHTLNASMFDVSDAQPVLTGNVTATPIADAKVNIESPNVSFAATATLHSDVQLDAGEIIKVGPTQTLLGSERTGIYRRGGTPDGEIIAEQRSSVGEVRDAQWQSNPDGSVRADVEAPWYSRPSFVSDTSRTATVNFLDKPSFELPATVGAGQLTETRGSDQFITALSAKRDEQVVHLTSSHWEVPWEVTIDAAGAGRGGIVTGGSSDVGPTTLDGPIAVQAAQEWLAFSTIETAMTASNRVLLDHLLGAKANDNTAYLNIVEALRRKNPTVSVSIAVGSTDAWVGTDDLELVVQGTQHHELGEINDRGTGHVSFNLCDVIDPISITASTNLEFELINRNWFGPSAPATMSWIFPFTDASGRMTGGGGGRYTLSGSIS